MNKMHAALQQDLLFHISRNLKSLVYQNIDELERVKKLSRDHNTWFESREIERMLDLIFTNYLDEHKLIEWFSMYEHCEFHPGKVVGIVAAGNIPLASFQDIWCALACGCSIQLKLSSKDQVVSRFIYDKINTMIPEFHPKIEFVNQLTAIDALIASGSNLTANHFKKFADKFPSLVRAHRNGVAILNGQETKEELFALGDDVFSFFGLGCRNVTKIYIPDKSMVFDLAKLFDSHYSYARDNSRYNNNYEYQLAVLSLNGNAFYQSSTIFFNESSAINSAIAVLNFETYDSLSVLEAKLKAELNKIQCICTNIEGLSCSTSKLGNAQFPELWDYQDGIDVIHFLQN